MDIKTGVLVMIGVVAVLLVLLALQGSVAGDWETVAQDVALVIVVIAFMGFIVAVVVTR